MLRFAHLALWLLPLYSLASSQYVGSKACAACHAAIYKQYSRTDMAQSLSSADRLVEKGFVNQPAEIFNPKHNRHYQVFRRGQNVYQSEYELNANGKEVFRHTEKIEYAMGTGFNGITAIVRRGNYLFQAPLSYYTAKKAWDLSPNYENQDLGFSFPISAGCIGCHSGMPRPVAGREGLFEEPPLQELAIGCERCHGPGQEHVAQRGRGPSIVNPAKLSPWLANNICMSCHEGDIRVLQSGKAELDFRPGKPLNETAVILKAPLTLNPGARETPLLEHYYSMTLSECYRKSDGKLGCLSCHNPHEQPQKQNAAAYFRAKCLQCHSEKSCTLDLQIRQKQQDDCAACHMPKQPALTVSHAALTDHRIVRKQGEPYPEIAFRESLLNTGFIHVNAVPGANPATIPPVVLLRAYRQELIRGRLEYKDYYFSLLDRLRESGEKDPFVLSALAQKASSDADLPGAIRYARQVIDLGSTSSYDYLLLDGLLAATGDTAACIDILKKALVIAPYDPLVYERLAARQLSTGNSAEALVTIRRGLELFPEDANLRSLQKNYQLSRPFN